MGLTHLVIGNSEHGFKQCLPLAYDSDSRKRSIFAHVFAKVISQGTVFDAEDKVPNTSRQTALADVRDCSLFLQLMSCSSYISLSLSEDMK